MLCVELIALNGVTEPVSVCNYLFSSKFIAPKFSEGDKSVGLHAGLISIFLKKILILDQTLLNSSFSIAEVAKQCIV